MVSPPCDGPSIARRHLLAEGASCLVLLISLLVTSCLRCSQECGSPGPQVLRDSCVCSQAVSSVSKVSGLELQKEPPLATSCNTWFLGVTPNRTQILHLLIVFCFFFQTVVSIANKRGFFSEKHLKSSSVSGSCLLPPSASSTDLATMASFFLLPCSF